MVTNFARTRFNPPIPWGDLAGRNIFMTGGTGFFGCNLLEAYTRAWDRYKFGGRVTVLTRSPAGFRLKAPHLAGHPGVEVVEGDLKDCDIGNSSWDFVIHAAVAYGEPLDILEGNQLAMHRVLELARSCNARRVLFTSSGAIYGAQPPSLSQMPEDYAGAPPLANKSAYGEAKRASELLGLLHGERYGYDFLIARCFAFMGPWLPLGGTGAAGNFIGDAMAGRPIRVRGDGSPLRSYLYAEELADWLWVILLRGVHGRPYNVGSGEALSILDLAQRVRDLLAPNSPVQIDEEAGQGPPMRYVPSVERAFQELGLDDCVGLDEAILRTASWIRSQPTSPVGEAGEATDPSRLPR